MSDFQVQESESAQRQLLPIENPEPEVTFMRDDRTRSVL